MTAQVFLGLGSNLGDRLENLRAAVTAIKQFADVQEWSSIYETPPWGLLEQPYFFNMVVSVRTNLEPPALLSAIKSLETRLGRVPSERYGPRLIDIDILLYGNEIYHLDDLQIPHPRLTERPFVLVPLVEIAPNRQHPVLKERLSELITQIDVSDVELFLSKENFLPFGDPKMTLRKELPLGQRTLIMGILNVTPDSFSGDGLLQQGNPPETALEQALRFVSEGADILDIGGESTRPGAKPVSVQEEIDRVVPLIARIRAELPDVPISIDTYKAPVAEAALAAGADWINDVWGLRADPNLAAVAAYNQSRMILMHNRSKPADAQLVERLGGRYIGVQYTHLMLDVCTELLESVAIARAAGIPDEHIILDPGIGFGKTVEQNLALLNHLDQIKALGFPLLLGVSRKSFIGFTLDLPPQQRLEGTLAAGVVGILRGADILRVHEVLPAVRAARMTDAIKIAAL